MTQLNPSESAYSIFKANNGDIYVGGLGAISRYTSDFVLISSAASPSGYNEMVVAQDGNVFLADGSRGFRLYHLSPELILVSSITVNIGSEGRGKGLALGPEGNVYVAGVSGEDVFGSDFKGYLLKLTPSLSIISSITINSGGQDITSDVSVSTSGAIYGAFVTINVPGKDMTLYRYDEGLNLVSSASLTWGGGSYTGSLDVSVSPVGDVFACGVGNSGYMARFTSEPSFVSSASISASIDYAATDGHGRLYLGGNSGTAMFVAKVSSSLVLESSVTYKGSEGGGARLYGIAADLDGNVFVSGAIESVIGVETNTDFWFGKFDETLSLISSSSINGESIDQITHFDSVALGSDGSVYVSGGSHFPGSGVVAKYTPDLVLISSVAGFNSRYGIRMDISDSGYIYFRTLSDWGVIPSTRTIYKYDQDLQFISSVPFGGCFYMTHMLSEVSGDVFLSGQDGSSWCSHAPAYIWKYNSDLALQSTVPFAGAYGFYDIAADEDGNLYPVGAGFPPGGGSAVGAVTKHAPDMTFLSSVTVPSPLGGGSGAPAVVVSTPSQRVFVGGGSGDNGGIWKYDYSLNMVSSVTFSGIPGDMGSAGIADLALAPDNNLLVTGISLHRLWLARLTQELVLISSFTLDLPGFAYDFGTSMAVSKNGNVYLAGGSGPSYYDNPATAWLGWFTYADEAGAQQGVAAAPFTALSTGSLTAVWSSTYQATTLYYASISTSPDFTPVLASSSTYNKSANFSGLAVNTTYYARVYDPLKGAMMDLGYISTLVRPPEFLFLDNVWSSSAAISWTPNGNPDWTKYVIALWDGGVSSATIASVSTTSAVIGLPEGTTIYLSVSSMNNDGLFPQLYPFISFLTLPAVQTAVQTDLGKMVLYSGVSGEITANIPAGSFAEAVSVTIKTPAPWNVPAPTAGLLALHSPVNLEVTLDKALQPSRNVEITVGYRDADLGGMDESKLVLARYDEAHGVWVPLPSTRDAANNKITAVTRHFSLFQVMQVTPAATLSGVTVGPNPLRPSRNPGQKFTFRNLPADGRVRIYTYLGELLWEGNADVSGMAVWDGRNKWNSAVASGLYLALVEGRGGKKLLKLVIER